jgi:hypothetical protein
MSDTPRMKAAQMAAIEHMTGDVYRVGCDIERELNAANAIIRQQQLLNEENLKLQERIKQLEIIISRASNRFFRNGSNGMIARGMLAILEEARKP